VLWSFHTAVDAFPRYRGLWDEINRSTANHILLDSTFVGSLIRHFASTDTLLGISDDGGNPGMVLLQKVKKGFWQTFQPSQGPLGLILLGNREGAVEQIVELIRSLPGYPLGFSVTQQDSELTMFKDLSYFQTLETVDYITTSRINLTGTFEEYWKRRGRYYIDDLRRQSRRLQEQRIEMEFVVERDPGRMAKCIGDYGRLEGVGWKGEEGTAVTVDNSQGLFYRQILEAFSSKGEAVVYRLLFNGETVASDLCLNRNGMLVVLKIAYDESFKGFSPGKFIHREILKALFTEGKIKVLEWYGRVHDWQIRLGSTTRTMFHVNFYRHRWVGTTRRYVKGIFRSADVS
jgi:hypothetical protein